MENFFLGLDYLRSLGFWHPAPIQAPKWENGFLYLPCYRCGIDSERRQVLESFGFSWSITGMLQYPIEQGRLI